MAFANQTLLVALLDLATATHLVIVVWEHNLMIAYLAVLKMNLLY